MCAAGRGSGWQVTPRLSVAADEPTAALDAASTEVVVKLFQRLSNEEHCTIVIVTHDDSILDVADRLISMIRGHITSNVLVRASLEICRFLWRVPLFQQFAPPPVNTLANVADRMKLEKYPAGTVIIRQGAEGDKFYLIRCGTVEVRKEVHDGSRHLATLGEGDFFGETSLVQNEPTNASVIAREDVELYALDKEHFWAVCGVASRSFDEELRRVIFSRQNRRDCIRSATLRRRLFRWQAEIVRHASWTRARSIRVVTQPSKLEGAAKGILRSFGAAYLSLLGQIGRSGRYPDSRTTEFPGSGKWIIPRTS